MLGMGTSMVLWGVAQMFAGNPAVGGPDDPANNGKFFDGPENTVTQGACIPVGYGTRLIGSLVISAGTSSDAYVYSHAGGPFGWNTVRMQFGPDDWAKLPWSKVSGVWTNGGSGINAPLCLGVDMP